MRMEISGKVYTERKEAGAAIIEACKALKAAGTEGRIGSYGAFELHSRFDNFDKVFRLSIKGALSLRNPWIQQMEQYKTPEVLDRNFVKKYIEQVVVTFLGDRQAEISLTMKTQEWKQMLERIELEGADDGTKK